MEADVLTIGVVLIVLALLIPSLHILFSIGIVLAVVGLVLLLMSNVRGGRHWY